jgi:hypothetical protein
MDRLKLEESTRCQACVRWDVSYATIWNGGENWLQRPEEEIQIRS